MKYLYSINKYVNEYNFEKALNIYKKIKILPTLSETDKMVIEFIGIALKRLVTGTSLYMKLYLILFINFNIDFLNS